MRTLIQVIGGLTVVSFIVCCQKSSPGATGATGAPGANALTDPSRPRDGSSTGGGSFGDESSLTILRWAADDLADQIDNSSPELYQNLPTGWTQNRLAQVIRNVRPLKTELDHYQLPDTSRYGLRLMFDYHANAEESLNYITATKLFVDAYSHYDVNTRPKKEFYYTIEEVKLKLLHEAAHLMNLGLSKETDLPEARHFAQSALDALDSDNFECLPSTPLPRDAYLPQQHGDLNITFSSDDPEAGKRILAERWTHITRAYVFNRPSGRAALPSNVDDYGRKGPGTVVPGEFIYISSAHDSGAFDLAHIRTAVATGQRSYGEPAGYFKWSAIDLRKAVRTNEGYKSDYKYEQEPDMNNQFHSYADFIVQQSSPSLLKLESYPPLSQEDWSFYRSQGKSQIEITFGVDGIRSAKLILLRSYAYWQSDKVNHDIHTEIPLSCRHSIKPIEYRPPPNS